MVSDELSLQPRREYDPTTQSIVGAPTLSISDKLKEKKIKQGKKLSDVLATKGCNTMICGLVSRWKQLCGFHYTGDSFNAKEMADWHKEMIVEAKKTKLTTKSLCLDMGSDKNFGNSLIRTFLNGVILFDKYLEFRNIRVKF